MDEWPHVLESECVLVKEELLSDEVASATDEEDWPQIKVSLCNETRQEPETKVKLVQRIKDEQSLIQESVCVLIKKENVEDMTESAKEEFVVMNEKVKATCDVSAIKVEPKEEITVVENSIVSVEGLSGNNIFDSHGHLELFTSSSASKRYAERPSSDASECTMRIEKSRQKSSTFNCYEHKRKRKHKDKKAYNCEHCSKEYIDRRNFINHLMIHSGERPNICEYCSRGFITRSNLVSHLYIHTGERRYSCEQCAKLFTHHSSLVRHLKVHSGERSFKCNHCDKYFSQHGNLMNHLKIHSGDRPHICTYCSRGFITRSNLVTHLYFHTGERPHSCKQCGRGFTQHSSLIRHLKVHTG